VAHTFHLPLLSTKMAYAADLCGSKLKAKLASTLNEASAVPMSATSFAAKQMAKMGWTEGTGLGKKRDGIVSHIKVQKREDSVGLGVEKERTRHMGVEGLWWSANLSETLMRLQQKKIKHKDEKKSKTSKKKKTSKKENETMQIKVYTDEELFAATGGARFGMRAQRRAEGKWRRTESSQSLREWEDQVKDKIEWNGLGQAKVLLRSSSSCVEDSEEMTVGKKRKHTKARDEDSIQEEKKEEECGQIDSTPKEENRGKTEKNPKKKCKLEKKKKKKKYKRNENQTTE